MPLPKPTLLIVDDDTLIGDSLSFALEPDFTIQVCESRVEAMTLLKQGTFNPRLALIDLGLPPAPHLATEGFKLINDLLAWSQTIRILVLSGQNEESNARRARALGAADLVPKPCDPATIKKILLRALAGVESDTAEAKDTANMLLGESQAMRKLRSQIDLYASPTFPTLIEGESGSGKERVAYALHHLSPRAHLPFLALNCAAISANLVEPTLFGYAKGAFTGAQTAKSGYFEDAGAGTLFLDEIGELPLDLQPKLLRVLENGEFTRVGETQVRLSKARVVAATNRDLKAEVKAGRFRADLYHRLSVFTISVPPLRELGNDKFNLLDHYRLLYAKKYLIEPFNLSEEARSAWLSYDFPGNVRELKNIVIRLTAKFGAHTLGLEECQAEFELPASIDVQTPSGTAVAVNLKTEIEQTENFSVDIALKKIELDYFDAALAITNGNMSQAAKLLGISRSTLYSRFEVLRPGSTARDVDKTS